MTTAAVAWSRHHNLASVAAAHVRVRNHSSNPPAQNRYIYTAAAAAQQSILSFRSKLGLNLNGTRGERSQPFARSDPRGSVWGTWGLLTWRSASAPDLLVPAAAVCLPSAQKQWKWCVGSSTFLFSFTQEGIGDRYLDAEK